MTPSTRNGPSIPGGRIDFFGRCNVLITGVLDKAAAWKPPKTASNGYFGLSTDEWRRSTALSLKALFGKTAKPHLSPVEGFSKVPSQREFVQTSPVSGRPQQPLGRVNLEIEHGRFRKSIG